MDASSSQEVYPILRELLRKEPGLPGELSRNGRVSRAISELLTTSTEIPPEIVLLWEITTATINGEKYDHFKKALIELGFPDYNTLIDKILGIESKNW
jgi:hypothetical protein